MPQAQTNAIKMVISQPTTFEQSEAICDLLKEKKSIHGMTNTKLFYIWGGIKARCYNKNNKHIPYLLQKVRMRLNLLNYGSFYKNMPCL